MIATAFSFVAALAWNEAIKTLISDLIPRGQGVISLFIYAAIVTVVAIVIGMRLLKIRERFEKDERGS